MSRYRAISNSSWGDAHRHSDRDGYVICEDINGLAVVVTVINRLGETAKETEARAKFVEYCLNHQSTIINQQSK